MKNKKSKLLVLLGTLLIGGAMLTSCGSQSSSSVSSSKNSSMNSSVKETTSTSSNSSVEEKTGIVTIKVDSNGTVTPSKTSGVVGDIITLTVVPNDGYELATLTHNGIDIKEALQFALVEGTNEVIATFTQSSVVTPSNRTDVTYSQEQDMASEDTFYYWNGKWDWGCSGEVTVNEAYVENDTGVMHYDYTLATEGAHVTYINQIFYKKSGLTGGTKYKLTFAFNSSTAGTIIVNGETKDIVVGDNSIEVEYTESTLALGNVGSSSLVLQTGGLSTEAGQVVFEISNLSWEEVIDKSDPIDDDDEDIIYTYIDVLARGASKTRFEGAGIFVWLNTEGKEITASTFANYEVTATVEMYDADGNEVAASVNGAHLQDFSADDNYVCAYITLNMAPSTDYQTYLNVKLNDGTNGYEADLSFTGTSYDDPNATDDDEDIIYTDIDVLARGASKTRFEGAGIFVWLNTEGTEITASTFANYEVTATVEMYDADGNEVAASVNGAHLQDFSADNNYVCAYITLNMAPGTDYQTYLNVKLNDGSNGYEADLSFTGTSYDDPNPVEDEVNYTAIEILSEGASNTRFEGAGIFVWLNTEGTEITASTFANYEVTATVEMYDADGNEVAASVNGAHLQDFSADNNYVCAYITLNMAPSTDYQTYLNVKLNDGSNGYEADAYFVGTTYTIE